MNSNEINRELNMTYYELCDYLIEKYGGAELDYFPNPQCKAKRRKVGRGEEGLYCHHIDEDKGGSLSSPDQARMQPFAWQKAERLVYCNILEHLILHIKIAVLRQKEKMWRPFSLYDFFTTGGFWVICREINSLYMDKGDTKIYRQRCYEEIKENFDDYVNVLNGVLSYLGRQFAGRKRPKTGIRMEDVRISEDDSMEEMDRKTSLFVKLSYADYMERIMLQIAWTFEGDIFQPVFSKLKLDSKDPIIDHISEMIAIDFKGYGHPQFNNDYIDERIFGSHSMDQYISNAFPTYLPQSYEIQMEKPVFWRGDFPANVLDKHLYYIVRFKAVFSIKPGKEAFVYNRKAFRIGVIDDENNFLFRKGYQVDTTDSPIEITMAKDDFSLFMQQYDVKSIDILDGCYFEE